MVVVMLVVVSMLELVYKDDDSDHCGDGHGDSHDGDVGDGGDGDDDQNDDE